MADTNWKEQLDELGKQVKGIEKEKEKKKENRKSILWGIVLLVCGLLCLSDVAHGSLFLWLLISGILTGAAVGFFHSVSPVVGWIALAGAAVPTVRAVIQGCCYGKDASYIVDSADVVTLMIIWVLPAVAFIAMDIYARKNQK